MIYEVWAKFSRYMCSGQDIYILEAADEQAAIDRIKKESPGATSYEAEAIDLSEPLQIEWD